MLKLTISLLLYCLCLYLFHSHTLGFPPRGFFGSLDLIEKSGARLIVGPTTSSTTVNAHVVASRFNIPLLGYTASSPDLSNKVLYPNFFRIDQSDAYQANAMAWIVKNLYSWPRVATLSTQVSNTN